MEKQSKSESKPLSATEIVGNVKFLMNSERSVLIACFVIFFSVGVARLIYLSSGGLVRLVQAVPDDAFYYIILAKNYAKTGFWTFDGDAPTTGFHLFWAYFLSLSYKFAPTLDFWHVFWFTGLTNVVLMATACATVSTTVWKHIGKNSICFVVLLFLSPLALNLSSDIMEGPIVVLCAAILFSRLPLLGTKPSYLACILAVFTGILGSLGRSDFGLVPASILAVQIFVVAARCASIRSLIEPTLGLFGASIGVVAVTVHSYGVSGGLLQASAATKLYWSSQIGHIFTPSIALTVFSIFPPLFGDYISHKYQSAFLAILTGFFGFFCAGNWIFDRARIFTSIGALMCLTGYTLVYSRDSGAIQPWYVANLLVPSALLLSAVLKEISARHSFVAILLCAGLGTLSIARSVEPQWPNQVSTLMAGLFLRDRPDITLAGAWNAGATSYFAARPVINLDGLVNDEIYQHLESGTLFSYIKSKKIDYIIDYEIMFTGVYPKRGGYSDGRLEACLIPVQHFIGNSRQPAQNVVLFRIKSDC